MALGPRLDLRQSPIAGDDAAAAAGDPPAGAVNLEVESFIAEEIEKNPLLETGGGEAEPGQPRRPAEAEAADGDDFERRGPARDRRRRRRRAARHRSEQRELPPGQRRRRDARPRRRPRPRRDRRRRRLRATGPISTASRASEVSLHDHLLPRPARSSRAPTSSSPTRSSSRSTRPAISSLRCSTSPSGSALPLQEVERVLGHRPDLRSGRRRRAQPRRMPRAPGEGRRPLRSGDGAADRQSRLSRQGQSRRAEADLRRRRRGPGRHDPRASRLRSQARLPLHGVGPGRRDRARRVRRPPRRRLGDRAQQRDPAAAAGQPHLLYRAAGGPAGPASRRPGCPNACRAPTG